MSVSKSSFFDMVEKFAKSRDIGADSQARVRILDDSEIEQISGAANKPKDFADKTNTCPYPDGYRFYECIAPPKTAAELGLSG